MDRNRWDFYGLALDFSGGNGDMPPVGSSYDPHELAAALQLLRIGDRALVAGGGLGSVSLLLAARIGNENVVTYEANPYLVRLAQNNISCEGGRLDFRHGALSTSTGQCDFYVSSHWALSSTRRHILQPGTILGTLQVPSINVNEALAQDRLSALVLDVEGAELKILPRLNFDLLRVLVVELHGSERRIAEARERIARRMTIEWDVVKSPTLRVIGAVG